MQSSERARRGPESSLATKIVLLVFLSTFVSAATVSWISIEEVRRQLWRQIDQDYPAVLQRGEQQVLRWLAEGRRATTELAAPDGRPEALLKLLTELERPEGRQRAQARFERLAGGAAGRSRGLEAFVLLGRDGTQLLRAGVMRGLTAQERAELVQPVRSRPHALIRPDEEALLAISVPIGSRPGQADAFLVGIFRPEGVREALASARLDVTTRIHLLDQAGRVLAHAGLPHAPATQRLPPAGVALGEVRQYIDSRGEHVIGSARAIDELGFTILVESSYDRRFAPMVAMLQRLILIDIGVVLLASLLAYAAAARMVRPIEALSRHARLIASGRTDETIPETDQQDEPGVLTRTINLMLRRLQRSQAALELANRQLQEQNNSLQATNEILEQLSITDGLTKLHNHRFFQDHLTREIKRANRTGEPLAMILLDIDDFKRLNDRLGHAAGDELLQGVARVLCEAVRESDLLARYGGEEFAIVSSMTDIAGAAVLAEKLRDAVAEESFSLEESVRPVRVTISLGVAQYKGDRRALFQSADQALYRAKREGKNCVRVAR